MMVFSYFPPLSITLLALSSGLIFGFLLRKATVSRFDTIVGQLLLRDFTVMKVIFTAIIVGSLGIYLLQMFEAIPSLHLSETPVLFSALGGCIFGIGMSVTGYCPGTAIAAIAEGSKDVVFAFFGMLLGAIVYNQLSPKLAPYLEMQDSGFKQTIATYFDFPHLAVIITLAIGWLILSYFLRNSENIKP